GAAPANDDEALLASSAADCPVALPAARLRDAVLTVAERTAATLSAAENARLWRALSSHACLREDPEAAPWLQLHAAIGARDAAAMRAQAQALLATWRADSDPRRHGLLVATAMLGALASGDAAGAMSVWHAHRAPDWRADSVNVHLRLLLATALYRAPPPRG
ncbi:MAG: hypothetical protein K2Y51_09730, partial [Gammaproteobacteria bacterium]|nr:hypothetical protein [Gammaproteobacteria bacterium]